MPLVWSNVAAALGAYSFVPETSGIYAFCDVHRCHNMPFELKAIYIGKAKNLRRRFREHLNPLTEHNLQLFDALKGNGVEFWFAVSNDIDSLEKELIQDIAPSFNQRIG